MGKTKNSRAKHISYFIGTALTASFGVPMGVHAEAKALEEVIVTAQKREESVQSVPIAITALTQAALETNRVTNVAELSGLAPNLTSRPSVGSIGVPALSMRGITSYGVVPGADKEISIYLDGVYLSSTRGSIFNLPDIAQLEVLRGPQGTLFGRNATAGALNITTHDPSGEFGFRQDLSYGNHAYYRQRTSMDSPLWGPFSFAGTYAKEKRQGDIRNLAAGTVWDRTASGGGYDVSPAHLGDKDTESYFFAARFQPTDTFTMTFKADKTTDHGTPNATSPVVAGTDQSAGFPLSPFFTTQPQNVGLNPNGLRPKEVNNAFAVPLEQSVVGQSLTTVVDVNDHVSLKNITAYRKTQVFAAVDLSGFGALTTPVFYGPIAGSPFCLLCTQNDADSDQWSSELQTNYESDLMTLTLGALYFESDDRSGGPVGALGVIALSPLPGNVLPAAQNVPGAPQLGQSVSYNTAQSAAVYGQAEFHVNDEIDLLAGLRETRDRKSGDYRGGSSADPTSFTFKYAKTKPSYMLGVNYKPTFDTLIYAKLSNAFVSGGSVGAVPFNEEVAKSWEAGIKSDFLESRLRSNLSVFYTNYTDVQTAQGGLNLGHPELSTLIVTQGPESAKGFEWEGSASVGGGVTLNASAGYTKIHFGHVDPRLIASAQIPGDTSSTEYLPIYSPEWTGSLAGNYDSDPLFGQSFLSFNVSGTWHSSIRIDPQPAHANGLVGFEKYEFIPASWVLNSRLALKDVNLGYAGGKGEIALWGRNLTDNRYPTYLVGAGGIAIGANYMDARSYGVDFTVKF